MSRDTVRKPPFNPSDPWFTSLANNAEFLFGALEAAGVTSVIEVGSYEGEFTQLLLDWAAPRGARVVAVDPMPQPPLERLAEQRDDLDLIRKTSFEALDDIELTDAIILDGDHNYYTVAGELDRIARAAGEGPLPLIVFHDVGWPHARRDSYTAIDTLPPEAVPHEVVAGGGLFPGDGGIRPDGLPLWHTAATEGGERNGVLTAIEDFMEGREGLRLVTIPSFFGLGVLWQTSAPYADALEAFLGPWDKHPVLQRMEDSRTLFLASGHGAHERDMRKYHLLSRLLMSRSFKISQWISKAVNRGEPAFEPADIRDRLAETDRPANFEI